MCAQTPWNRILIELHLYERMWNVGDRRKKKNTAYRKALMVGRVNIMSRISPLTEPVYHDLAHYIYIICISCGLKTLEIISRPRFYEWNTTHIMK